MSEDGRYAVNTAILIGEPLSLGACFAGQAANHIGCVLDLDQIGSRPFSPSVRDQPSH
jgi:hypothetical protein